MLSPEMPFFSVGDIGKERVEVKLLGPPADRKSPSWLQGLVQIDVGGFKSEVGIWFDLSDLLRFKEQLEPLYERLEGVAEFKTLEDQLAIRIEVDKLGHVHASGYLLDNFDRGNKLHFNIVYDQTLLWHTIAEIDEVLHELSSTAA